MKTKIQETYSSDSPARRLQAIASHASTSAKEGETFVLVLPDGGKVTASLAKIGGGSNVIILNCTAVLSYTISETQTFTFDISSVGTRYQGVTSHLPRYKLLTLSPPKTTASKPRDVTISDFWVAIYALYTLHHTQEQLPVTLSQFPNAQAHDIGAYVLKSGLGRTYPISEIVPKKPLASEDILFISRAAFWQGAGTTGYHQHGWLLNPRPIFPSVASYTRTEKVIAMHPLRPAKPQPGEVLYRRWCSAVGQMVEITHFDLDGEHDGTKAAGAGLSKHMAAFHKWHNDERVNTAWGERGSLETHRDYVEGLLKDPHVIPCMLSWDGELMGYVEIVYTKEDHTAQHYPSDIGPGDWERGIHVLVGETKFLGGGRCEWHSR